VRATSKEIVFLKNPIDSPPPTSLKSQMCDEINGEGKGEGEVVRDGCMSVDTTSTDPTRCDSKIASSPSNESSLIMACKNGDLEGAKRLIQECGVDPNIGVTQPCGKCSVTPLYVAAMHDKNRIVHMLIKCGANVDHGWKADMDNHGFYRSISPLTIAAFRDHWSVVFCLVRNGASHPEPVIEPIRYIIRCCEMSLDGRDAVAEIALHGTIDHFKLIVYAGFSFNRLYLGDPMPHRERLLVELVGSAAVTPKRMAIWKIMMSTIEDPTFGRRHLSEWSVPLPPTEMTERQRRWKLACIHCEPYHWGGPAYMMQIPLEALRRNQAFELESANVPYSVLDPFHPRTGNAGVIADLEITLGRFIKKNPGEGPMSSLIPFGKDEGMGCLLSAIPDGHDYGWPSVIPGVLFVPMFIAH
jgi:hypothetical protein